MSYSALYLKKGRKILPILGVLSIVSVLMGGIFLVNQLGRKNGWQQVSGIDRAYVANRSAYGFEVVWSTRSLVKEEQWVEVGTQKGMYPIRSAVENNGKLYRAIISGLQPNTTYYFRVRIGSKTYILPSLVSEIVQTPKDMKEKPISPAYGKVLLPSTKPYSNGLLIYEIDGYYPLAVFTKQTGEWLLPLTGLIEKKTNTIATVADSTPVLITLFEYPEGSIRTVVGQTRPLRQAIVAGSILHLAQTLETAKTTVLGASTQAPLAQTTANMLSIIYPKENALIPGNTPIIRGTGQIGKDVTVLIQGNTKQYSYRAKSDEKGNWLVQYPVMLEAGRYSIVATFESSSGGSPTVLTRTFSIIKSGEQVLGVATGTPTLIPTIPIVPTTFIVPTYANPTTNPTIIPVVETIYPTALTPTRFVPTPTTPITGGGISPFLFGAVFCIVTGAALVLAF